MTAARREMTIVDLAATQRAPSEYAGENMNPLQPPGDAKNRDTWHHNVCCACCDDLHACMESCCCFSCQISRQCNLFVNNKPEIHWPFCLTILCTNCCVLYSCVSCMCICQTRDMARKRYGIKGSSCNDCCVACMCQPCAVQQVLMELTVHNDFPGATCYVPTMPATVHMF